MFGVIKTIAARLTNAVFPQTHVIRNWWYAVTFIYLLIKKFIILSVGRIMLKFYRPQTKFAMVMFLHLSVILFTGGGGFPACITGHMTRGVCIQGGLHLGGSALGWGVVKTPSPGILWDTVKEWAVRILLECILV